MRDTGILPGQRYWIETEALTPIYSSGRKGQVNIFGCLGDRLAQAILSSFIFRLCCQMSLERNYKTISASIITKYLEASKCVHLCVYLYVCELTIHVFTDVNVCIILCVCVCLRYAGNWATVVM